MTATAPPNWRQCCPAADDGALAGHRRASRTRPRLRGLPHAHICVCPLRIACSLPSPDASPPRRRGPISGPLDLSRRRKRSVAAGVRPATAGCARLSVQGWAPAFAGATPAFARTGEGGRARCSRAGGRAGCHRKQMCESGRARGLGRRLGPGNATPPGRDVCIRQSLGERVFFGSRRSFLFCLSFACFFLLLPRWGGGRVGALSATGVCPQEGERVMNGTICPDGSWNMRHTHEEHDIPRHMAGRTMTEHDIS